MLKLINKVKKITEIKDFKMDADTIVKIIKSITPLQIVFFLPFYNFNNMFYVYSVINLLSSSLFLHPSITYYNYNYEHTIVKYCYNYDKFSILLICLYFTTNYKYLSLIASLCLLQYESLKDISYLLTILTNLYYQNYLAPPFAFIALYSYKKRLQQKEWTLSNKLVWHSSQAIYLCLCSYKYN